MPEHPFPKFVEWMDSVKNSLDLKTDTELSRFLGVSGTAVSRWRDGITYPKGETLCAIADKLSLDVRPLLRMVGWLKTM